MQIFLYSILPKIPYNLLDLSVQLIGKNYSPLLDLENGSSKYLCAPKGVFSKTGGFCSRFMLEEIPRENLAKVLKTLGSDFLVDISSPKEQSQYEALRQITTQKIY